MTFRYIATDMVTGAYVGELPLHDVTFTTVLSGAGPIAAKLRLPLDDLDLAGAYLDATSPLKRAIYVEYDGIIVWAGLIWVRNYDTDTQDLQIAGVELWSYWRRRRIRWDAEYGSDDQFRIVRDLLQRAAAQPGGNVMLILPYIASGVGRDATWRGFEDKPLGEAIEELAHSDDGFDFWIEVIRTGATFQRIWRVAHPRRGRPVEQSGLYLTLGNNMLKVELPEDGRQASNSFYAVGAGEGVDMLSWLATDVDMITDGFPLLEDGQSFKDAKLDTQIMDLAIGELNARKDPAVLPTATVFVDWDPKLGTYWPGDEGLLQVFPGTEPRWPDGAEVAARLNAFTVRVPDDGDPPTASLVFEELAA